MRKNKSLPVSNKRIGKPKRVGYLTEITKGTFCGLRFPFDNDVVHFSIGQSDEEIVASLRSVGVNDKQLVDYLSHKNNRVTEGRCKSFGKYIIVRLMGGINTTEGIGTLTHEIVHAAHRLIECWENKKKFENKEELLCCLVNFMLERIMNQLRPQIHSYGDNKTTWQETFQLEYNFGLHTKRKTTSRKK